MNLESPPGGAAPPARMRAARGALLLHARLQFLLELLHPLHFERLRLTGGDLDDLDLEHQRLARP